MDRETLDFDVVFVGAGPANLSGALHLNRLIKNHNEVSGNALATLRLR
jgi:electron-transferring-flavoprotein dehydrogenase